MNARRALRALAQDAGIQLAYRDIAGRRHVAQDESLLAVLRALGLPIERPEEAEGLLRERRAQRAARRSEPVQVWTRGRGRPRIRLTGPAVAGRYTLHLRCEDGAEQEFAVTAEATMAARQEPADPTAWAALALPLPADLPIGYHEVAVVCPDGHEARTLLMVRPATVVVPEAIGLARSWGTFLPLYAHWRDAPSDGATYERLREFVAWTRRAGGTLVGTLPLLPVFLGEAPFDPSPYAPVSRLFWNEFYCDVAALAPGVSPTAPLVTVEGERGTRWVDYAATWRRRRAALAWLAARLDEEPELRDTLARWVATRPEVERYARFRAAVDRYGPPSDWPAELRRDRALRALEATADERLYLVGQWLAAQQLGAAERSALYLDLPLGVHPEGFDVWRWPHLFATGASAGAPPDPFFAGGQVWGFPPLHPERIREEGYRYVRAVLAHHLGAARLLRIDHVMGFHRLYWVPAGASGRDGLYVRYRPEEFYAVLAIESQRAGCAVAGEDLGTVPTAVRRAMAANGLLRLWVLPFERHDGGFRTPPRFAVASLETHDLPPFAALWEEWGPGLQQAVRHWLAGEGYLDADADGQDLGAVLGALLRFLGASPAEIVLTNVEDFWFEREPQNRPGTGLEQPNWRRLAQRGLSGFAADPTIGRFLETLDASRKGGLA
ncbi:MAG: 4-alpha-glucanotransferase [Thermomicrobium sp.]|nr:4-alpha-glucanotransferase [Thermomicrobium sp.]